MDPRGWKILKYESSYYNENSSQCNCISFGGSTDDIAWFFLITHGTLNNQGSDHIDSSISIYESLNLFIIELS